MREVCKRCDGKKSGPRDAHGVKCRQCNGLGWIQLNTQAWNIEHDQLWMEEPAFDAQGLQTLEHFKMLVECNRQPNVAVYQTVEGFNVVDGRMLVVAHRELGKKTVACVVIAEPGTATVKEWRGEVGGVHLAKEQLRQWGRGAQLALPPSKVQRGSEQFGKSALHDFIHDEYSTDVEDALKLKKQLVNPCAEVPISNPISHCGQCNKIIPRGTLTCQECDMKNKVPCLEPGCKDIVHLIRGRDRHAKDYFCQDHSDSELPLVDRDGDSIWFDRHLEVFKVKNLTEEHLTNAIIYLEDSAKRRCKITGVCESKFMERVGPRYRFLVEEAKRRDAHLKCMCRDGVKETRSSTTNGVTTVEEVICEECILGRDRLAAKQLAQQMSSEGRKMTIKVATVMIMSLLAGGTIATGQHFVQMVIQYLTSMGALK